MASGHRNNWQQKSNSGELEGKNTQQLALGVGWRARGGAGRGAERAARQAGDGHSVETPKRGSGLEPAAGCEARVGAEWARWGARRTGRARTEPGQPPSLRAASERVRAQPACGLGPAWDPAASGREQGGPWEGELPCFAVPGWRLRPRARSPRRRLRAAGPGSSRGRVRAARASNRPASRLPGRSSPQPVRAAA